MQRILGFDFLRGICALIVAIVHLSYVFDILPASYQETYNLAAVYSVCIFFVLSGASMVVAYEQKFSEGFSFQEFIARRFVRLAPLYWLVMLLSHGTHGLHKTLLNMSFMFGFGNPVATARTEVAWSLGIEFVFYFVFPVFLFLITHKRNRWIWLGLAFLFQFVFLLETLKGEVLEGAVLVMSKQFLAYVGYFLAGCIIGKLINEGKVRLFKSSLMSWGALSLLFAAIFVGLRYADQAIYYQFGGVLLALSSVLLVYVSAYLHFPKRMSFLPVSLGAMSYGVYLIHLDLARKIVKLPEVANVDSHVMAAVVLLAVIALALLLEKFFEKPIRRFGYRKFTKSSSADRIVSCEDKKGDLAQELRETSN